MKPTFKSRRWAEKNMAEFTATMDELRTTEDAGLPPDPENKNDNRANWARKALIQYMACCGTDAENAVIDLLADLRHFCDRVDIDCDEAFIDARDHYLEETTAPELTTQN